MSTHRDFSVVPIGIPESDAQILHRILKISSGSSRSYSLTDEHEPAPGRIVIVNADSATALRQWRLSFCAQSGKSKVPTIFAGKTAMTQGADYALSMPFRATHLLSMLDRITIKELNYIPELTIGDEQGNADIAHKALDGLMSKPSTGDERYTAMVVDDSGPVRKQLELELKLLGARVEMAENGEQAMEMTRSNRYDIIFLDVVMPGIDGYKVCKAIKKNIKTKNIPVIMLTGKSSPFDRVKGTLAGCDTYLTKPLQHDDFQTIAKKYLVPA